MVNSIKIIGSVIALFVSNASALSIATPHSRGVGTKSTTNMMSATAFRREAFVMASTTEDISMVTGSAVLDERTVGDKKQKERDIVEKNNNIGGAGWEVRILNDGENTREYVAVSLVEVASLSEVAAYQTMMQAHQNGSAVIGRWVYERAEMYVDALQKNGIVCDMVPVMQDGI